MATPATREMPAGMWLLALALALVALTIAVYWRVGSFGFVSLDDGRYVFDSPEVRRGLTLDGVGWAFTKFRSPYWQPLAWLSHMADVTVFGLDAGWHHRVNVLWHCANAGLLFAVLTGATRSPWRSAFVAALFAVHPLHVESVAWVAERKDVLSTFFWLSAVAAYLSYVRRPGVLRYLGVLAAFVLGLMCKPMVITLPAVLLLLDYWPLGRLSPPASFRAASLKLAWEKVPFLVIGGASALATYLAPGRDGSFSAIEHLPMSVRLANGLVSYAQYLSKTVWPSRLAVIYPHPGFAPGGIPAVRVVGAVVVLLAISSLVVWQRKRQPWLVVGWLWFLGTLVPVLGLVQVGPQGMADRFTYVPLIGLFIAVAWALPRKAALAVPAVAAVLAAATVARLQAEHWKDSFTLYTQAATVTEGNWVAWKNLGVEHVQRGEPASAIAAFRESLRARPDDQDVWLNLAVTYGASGQLDASVACFKEALRLDPADLDGWFNLGVTYTLLRQPELAAETVERLRPLSAAKAQALVQRISELQQRP